jgi:hypothetical protein
MAQFKVVGGIVEVLLIRGNSAMFGQFAGDGPVPASDACAAWQGQ